MPNRPTIWRQHKTWGYPNVGACFFVPCYFPAARRPVNLLAQDVKQFASEIIIVRRLPNYSSEIKAHRRDEQAASLEVRRRAERRSEPGCPQVGPLVLNIKAVRGRRLRTRLRSERVSRPGLFECPAATTASKGEDQRCQGRGTAMSGPMARRRRQRPGKQQQQMLLLPQERL